jgi:ferric-dicitrate binding protein FerR (iron transport regulator)
MSTPDDLDGPDDAYLWDGHGTPSAELGALEAALRPLAQAPVPASGVTPIGARRRRAAWAVALGVAALAAAALFFIMLRARPAGCTRPHGFGFTASGDTARCGGARMARGELAPGDRLDTFGAEVTLAIADIGSAQIAPGSRVALAATGPAEHRLRLERGAMHARVSAVPRLFVVETPAATAVDLGCEYTLRVGPDGRGELIVLAGAVELSSAGGPVTVPAGMRAQLVPGQGGTLPLRADAPTALYDAANHGAPLVAAISSLRAEDAVSWLHLALGRDASAREVVRAALASVGVTGPSGPLDDAALRRWIDELVWRRPPGSAPTSKSPPSKAPAKTPPSGR